MLNKLKNLLKIIKNFSEKKENTIYIQSQEQQKSESIFDITSTMYDSLKEDVIRFEIGTDIIEFANEISFVIGLIRETLKRKTGFILPPVHYFDNMRLQENEIKVYLNGNELYSKFLIPVQEEIEKEIEDILYDLFRNHLKEIFTNESVERYIDAVKKYNNKLSADIVYNLSSIEIKYILIELLKNGKSIKNITYVFEMISEQIFMGKPENKNKLIELSEQVIKNI